MFASTTGLIFFGTPFRGAEGMSQASAYICADVVGLTTNTDRLVVEVPRNVHHILLGRFA